MPLPQRLPDYHVPTIPKFLCKKCGAVFIGTKPKTHTASVLIDINRAKLVMVGQLNGKPVYQQINDRVLARCDGEVTQVKIGYNEALQQWITDTAKEASANAENSKQAKQHREEVAYVGILSRLRRANPVGVVTWFYNLYQQGAFAKEAHIDADFVLHTRTFNYLPNTWGKSFDPKDRVRFEGVTTFDINGGEPLIDEEEEFVSQFTRDILSRRELPVDLSPAEKEEQERTITQSRRRQQPSGPRVFYLNNQLCMLKPRVSMTAVPVAELKKPEKTLPNVSQKKAEEFSIVLTGEDGTPEKIKPEE